MIAGIIPNRLNRYLIYLFNKNKKNEVSYEFLQNSSKPLIFFKNDKEDLSDAHKQNLFNLFDELTNEEGLYKNGTN